MKMNWSSIAKKMTKLWIRDDKTFGGPLKTDWYAEKDHSLWNRQKIIRYGNNWFYVKSIGVESEVWRVISDINDSDIIREVWQILNPAEQIELMAFVLGKK